MTAITLEEKALWFDGRKIGPDHSFEEVLSLLGTRAYSVLEPDEKGWGSIHCREVSCCGLWGYAVFFFEADHLARLSLHPQWHHYDMTDGAGGKLSVYQGAEKIARQANQELEAAVGRPVFRSEAASIYVAGEIRINAAINRDWDDFVMNLCWEAGTVPRLGYALAPRQLVDQGRRVRFCYREEPDDETDSGWRFFSGEETQEMMEDPDQIGLYDITTIARIDPDVIPLLAWRAGFAFVRQDPAEPFQLSKLDEEG